MGYYVYILHSQKDGELYIGFATDMDRRLNEHSHGYVASTKFRLPIQLIHYEFFTNRYDAEAREVFLKSGAGHSQIKAKLKRSLKDLTRVS